MYAVDTVRDVYHFNVDNGTAVFNEVYFFTGQQPMGPVRFFLAPSKP